MKLKEHISVRFTVDLVKSFNQHELTGSSAQMAYFFLLSLFPLLLFLVTLIGYFPIDMQALMDGLREYFPVDAVILIETTIDQVIQSSSGSLLSLGLLGTLWSASNGINALMRSLNKTYGVIENRSFILGRLLALLLLLSMLALIIIALLLPVFGKAIGEYVFSFFGASDVFISVWNLLRWVISTSLFLLFFLYLYMFAPNTKVYVSDAIYGALFATIGYQLASLGFGFYVNNFRNYSATYGSLGGIIITIFWFYITGIVILLGGQINALIAKYRGRLIVK